jgi:hypothetical protein
MEELVSLVRGLACTHQVGCIEALFQSLPDNCLHLRRFRRLALAPLYMARAFQSHKTGDVVSTRAAITNGILHDPSWLRNRGVRAILARSLTSKLWPYQKLRRTATSTSGREE